MTYTPTIDGTILSATSAMRLIPPMITTPTSTSKTRSPTSSPKNEAKAIETSPDSTGWNVHYYSRSGGIVVSPAALGRAGSDVQPSVRLR